MDTLKKEDSIVSFSEGRAILASESATIQLNECCKQTIDMHAANNPMMVCSDCKQIIKYFNDDRAYRNYQVFCASRHRRILATDYKGLRIIVYRSS
jgi:hypothetical protein